VTHPVLGSGVASIVIAAGENNIASYQWELLDGVPELRQAWVEWNLQRETALRQTHRLPIGLGVASAGFVTAVAILLGGAHSSGGGAGSSRSDGLAASDRGAQGDLRSAWDSYSEAVVRERALLTAAGVVAGVAVTGIGLTVAFGAKGDRQRARLLPWEPWETHPGTTTP
jgi:hypothetical protein